MMRLELELSKLLHDSVFFSLPTDEISELTYLLRACRSCV